jgi:glycosyltransferase involved in cell wall biosynthesis
MTDLNLVDKPLRELSVLVSSFNKFEFLAASALTLHEISNLGAQVVIVEDSSTDGSIETIKSWPGVKNGIIQLIVQENSGSAESRNKALTRVERDYILFLDIDDDVDLNVLKDLFPQIVLASADIALSGYLQVPANRIGPFPLSESAGLTINIADFRTELLQGMGWWRYFYKSRTLIDFELHFTPTFKDMGNKIFVLDDLFWLLHLFSMDIKMYRAHNSEILYKYFLPDQSTPARRDWYLDQVVLMPQALRIFLQDLKSHKCQHDEKWLMESSQVSLWQHANFLDSRRYFKSIHNYVFASIAIDINRKDFSFKKTTRFLLRSTLRILFLEIKSAFNS